MYKRCISIMSCSQTKPGMCSQTWPGISLCFLSGLFLHCRGQFLVLLNQSKQDQEYLSALSLDCLCQTGLTPWSVSLPFHRTILVFLLLCKIMFPGPVGTLADMVCKSLYYCSWTFPAFCFNFFPALFPNLHLPLALVFQAGTAKKLILTD